MWHFIQLPYIISLTDYILLHIMVFYFPHIRFPLKLSYSLSWFHLTHEWNIECCFIRSPPNFEIKVNNLYTKQLVNDIRYKVEDLYVINCCCWFLLELLRMGVPRMESHHHLFVTLFIRFIYHPTYHCLWYFLLFRYLSQSQRGHPSTPYVKLTFPL